MFQPLFTTPMTESVDFSSFAVCVVLYESRTGTALRLLRYQDRLRLDNALSTKEESSKSRYPQRS